MAVIENDVLMKFKDSSGNVNLLYPITRAEDVDRLQEAIRDQGVITEGTGAVYTATVEGITSLSAGVSFVMIPHVVSAASSPKLNVNSLGEKFIRRRVSGSTTTVYNAKNSDDWLAAGKPVRVTYDGTQWITDMYVPYAGDFMGTLAISSGGTGATTAAQARINLGIETADGTVISGNADYAEVGEWVDGNPDSEDRIGYFVCIDNTTAGTTMRKATNNDDVRGVTVASPAFAGGCNSDKYATIEASGDSDPDADAREGLLPQYDYVAVMGIVSVIDDGTCIVNGRCIPNGSGIATSVEGDYGYQVINRIDDTHILIAMEPGTDAQYKFSKNYLQKTGGAMSGPISMGGNRIGSLGDPIHPENAATKRYVDTAVRKAAPVNLLDNSDFRNPVNQRGQTSYGTEGYTIDRWIMLADIGVINVVHGGLNLDAANHAITFAQYLDDGTLASMVASGKKYTVAINYTVNTVGGDANLFERPKNGGINRAFAFETGLGNHTSFASFTPDATGGNFQYAPVWMYLSQGWNVTLHWIALYEGEYTAETLPEYRPKGYMVEALNCGGVSMANSVVMEYSLGTSFTDEQSADIRSGKFEKVHVGGYWTINGRKYWAAHADYRLHCGDTELTTHHMLVIPEKSLLNMNWNGTNDTTGGYVSSKVKTEGMAQALEIVKGDFGADHILNHRIILTNAVSNGASSGWAWYDSQIDLMNEHMVYGSHAWGGGSQNGYDTGADKSQLALFQARPDLITNRENWWLRDVYSASHPCLVEDKGTTSAWGASDSIGVRPAFLIY